MLESLHTRFSATAPGIAQGGGTTLRFDAKAGAWDGLDDTACFESDR